MTLLKNAELFAKLKHAGKLKKSGTTYSNHLENVVSRLKSLGVIDEEVLCAAWLQDILEDTETNLYAVRDGIVVVKKGAVIPNGFVL